jgi:hypothetical protein
MQFRQISAADVFMRSPKTSLNSRTNLVTACFWPDDNLNLSDRQNQCDNGLQVYSYKYYSLDCSHIVEYCDAGSIYFEGSHLHQII